MTLQWSIFIANLEPSFGSEQGSTRPVIVISNEAINKVLNIVDVVPITSVKPNRNSIYPNEVLIEKDNFGLNRDSIVLTFQIRALDKRRLRNKIGVIDAQETKDQIIEALKFQLDID